MTRGERLTILAREAKRANAALKAEIIAAVNAGASARSVARTVGLSHETVRRWALPPRPSALDDPVDEEVSHLL